MADKSLFSRLKKLFSTGVVIRRIGDKKLKVVDTNALQADGNLESNRLVDRYSKLYAGGHNSNYEPQQTYLGMRTELFNDYEAMDMDSIIASALDIYAEECTVKNAFGLTLQLKSPKKEINDILHNLFYDILNIEFNLYLWIRSMCKYGDFFLKMDIVDKYGVVNVVPISPYFMVREENIDPKSPDLVKFYIDESTGGNSYATGMVGGGRKAYLEDYEVAHFRLIGDTNFLPYGKAMIEPARRVWKQLTLMEDAMLIHRIMRAPERRIFKVDIGNIPPNEVEGYMNKVINKIKKTPYVDEKTGDYNLKFNLMNMLEDYYLPVRGGQSGTEIDTLSGMEFTGIDDIEYLRNRMFAALKIPKAFIGYEENVEGKATLAAQDVRFSRTIERIQKIVVSELTKIAIVHLYSQGYTNEDLVDFELSLTNPSTISEEEKLELWSTKVDLASSIKDLHMLSEDWIYKYIFDMADEDVAIERKEVIEDIKQRFRKGEIEQEGNDPIKTGEIRGSEYALAQVGGAGGGGGFPGQPGQDSGGEEPEGTELAFEDTKNMGRPKEGPKSGTRGNQDSARGRDPLGKETKKRDVKYRDRKIESNVKSSPLAKGVKYSMDSKLKKPNILKETSFLDEKNLLNDENL
tara:strand:- start:7251 stop:9146 length:1896 start_codon:yes stop_codon:yes gene_type:complete